MGSGKEMNNMKKGRTPTSSKDRHVKVGGRDPRFRLSPYVASRLFNLTKSLGFQSDGQTIGWLLENSESAISAATRQSHHVNTTPRGVSQISSCTFGANNKCTVGNIRHRKMVFEDSVIINNYTISGNYTISCDNNMPGVTGQHDQKQPFNATSSNASASTTATQPAQFELVREEMKAVDEAYRKSFK